MHTDTTVLYLSHGGGPLPLMGDKKHNEMVDTLKHIAAEISKPSAILLISAHWEERDITITHGRNPPLIYDYYGFPDKAYHIQYPVLGHPDLANKVASLFHDNGMKAILDDQRGFDHGLFVPLKIMYPKADIPCVQLSLLNNLDALQHIKIGQILAKLAYEDLLIIGSGLSFHNIHAFFHSTPQTQVMNESFEAWLIETCSNKNITEMERTQRLIHWDKAPSARYCHPREEHLLPLHVCYGVKQQACKEIFELSILDKKTSMYLWQHDANKDRKTPQ